MIILALVISLDGKMTHGKSSRIHLWTSREDQAYFASLLSQSEAIIMGRKTFSAGKRLFLGMSNVESYVLTRNPTFYSKKYSCKHVTFIDLEPVVLVSKLREQGLSRILLIGGTEINTAFLKAKLVDEIWITIEPVIVGEGKSFVSLEELYIDLKAYDVTSLNTQGTLVVKYHVVEKN